MAKIFIRQRRFSYIKTSDMKSPQVRGSEEVWQDDQGQVTYIDNERVYRPRISADDQTKPSSVFSHWPMSERRDWGETPLGGDSFSRLGEDRKMRKIEIVSSPPAKRKIAAELRNWWQKAANQTEKLARRLKSAWRAAHKELTRRY